MSKLAGRLAQPGILVADGATGTMLQRAGLPRGMAPERWNLENPGAIQDLHTSYLEAGADVILTNSFGGTRYRLERDGLSEQVHQVNRSAAQLARQAAGEQMLVFGDIGPLGALLKPLGKITYIEARDAFTEQADGLAEGEVDAILIETMSDLNEAKAAVEGVRLATDLPVIVTMSFDTHGYTVMGVSPKQAVEELWSLGLAAVGANCGRTLSETLDAIQEMRRVQPDVVLMAKPNAGLPQIHSQSQQASQLVYDVTPEVMGEYACQYAEWGVKIFGGCCGSTPEHIRAIAKALKKTS
jgi:5-methyltetrahydrofolate--homocysteine methyltransferase